MPKIKNPLSLIKKDHNKVKSLFERYDKSKYEKKKSLSEEISKELSIHMRTEEELFYPRLEGISGESDSLISEAKQEHDKTKERLEAIKISGDEETLDMRIKEMEDGVLHHIQEEENKIFPLAEEKLKDQFPELSEKISSFKKAGS
ncbi:MAG: hypothetical protein A2365_03220 [Candidatus Nealsonbacteria bacterium RIFOXYB1_FULL_40_15]|uniref:Hemerythrin-like domain-containing protein n=2 Tax=Candidatus Nealsoniibacteriota TaxID=1817911 RepID=A0A1G2ETQ5_9BACT|nr:MAG: hypothetical protein A2365_03220 [Candidatus Nealsonbacteria bacterium RIFOXYB1_FULL_40_15]OGZ29235.1 MAG: hypothetical protein A2427_03080 [Candidatus Nealsonbacteria bacterium RIFOXYC1_FULL_40_7]OGZ29584.1 MAG: hypothetical protein A2562_03050 [Candidatus Nealsonbacteria bacterium RIFOXYD1_FULL_39_11]